eukprot:CAMPEP_0169245504 /NCGR_PEP_ID=MMETSP1016-20121227/34224_1 /TAXON_ID=342587 /ORGANISM="Karlodinium micrum, Strain CCMP2283" /LENGTH=499 /DNA_ID=CAMNT_0009325997 /DNA_START=18 /DNA_END=1517 /DNA_ORIENTATION=+
MESGSTKHTIGSVLDQLGMTRHHWHVTILAWWIFFLSGWVYAMAPYLLDAVGGKHTDWVERTSKTERMHDSTKSIAMLFAGFAALLGNPIMGYLADSYGRISTMAMALLLVSVGTLGFAFSSSWKMLVACMCLAPFGRDGTNPIAQSLMAEWVPIAYRGRLIAVAHLVFNIGRLALTVLWLICPPRETWLTFFLASSALPVLTTVYLVLRGASYESPRWLALAGRYPLLKANLCLAAQSCDNPLAKDWCEPANLGLDGQFGSSALKLDDGKPVAQRALFAGGIGVDARMTGLRTTICLFGVCFFCVSYASWGMFTWTIDFLKAIEANAAVSAVFASPLAKIFGNVVLVCPWFGKSPIDYFGRLLIFRIGMFGFSTFLFAFCLCGNNSFIITTVVFGALMFEEFVWTVGSTCVTEAFPTSFRNTASAYIFMCASAGGIVASAVSLELLHRWQYLPIVVMASLLMFGFVTSWALPDDRKDKLLMDTCKKEETHASYNTLTT